MNLKTESHVRRKRRNFFLVVPFTFFGSTSTIDRFGERFRVGQYSLVSFLSAVPLFTVPLCPAICKSWGHVPPCPWSWRHWLPPQQITTRLWRHINHLVTCWLSLFVLIFVAAGQRGRTGSSGSSWVGQSTQCSRWDDQGARFAGLVDLLAGSDGGRAGSGGCGIGITRIDIHRRGNFVLGYAPFLPHAGKLTVHLFLVWHLPAMRIRKAQLWCSIFGDLGPGATAILSLLLFL